MFLFFTSNSSNESKSTGKFKAKNFVNTQTGNEKSHTQLLEEIKETKYNLTTETNKYNQVESSKKKKSTNTLSNLQQEAPTNKKLRNQEGAVDFVLEFSRVPVIKGIVSLDSLSISTKLSSQVLIDKNKLKVKDQTKTTIEMQGYSGSFILDEGGMTLDGESFDLSINGISLSSDSTLPVSFTDLDYSDLNIKSKNVKFKSVSFPSGRGKIKIADRLDYNLKDDAITIYNFSGTFAVNKDSGLIFKLMGKVGEAAIQGSLMDLTFQGVSKSST